jgi:hypothetical protein
MPIKDPEKRKAWFRKYRKATYPQRRTTEQERLMLWYQENLADRRKANITANRAAGRKPRPKGPAAKPEVVVGTSKRYRFLNGLIYFTSKRGFEISELREILRLVSPSGTAKPGRARSRPSVRRRGSAA